MKEIIPFILSGLVFGLIAGILPGPLLTLVITETIKHSKKQGIKVAIAPLITDIPVICVCIFILDTLARFHYVLGIISLLGAVFIMYLGYESLTTKGVTDNIQNAKPHALKRGVIVNVLNPHPYIFWLTIGAPLIVKSYEISVISTVLFISVFYIFLVGSKMIIAVLVNASRTFLKDKIYIWTMRILGLILFVFACLFIKEGLTFLAIL